MAATKSKSKPTVAPHEDERGFAGKSGVLESPDLTTSGDARSPGVEAAEDSDKAKAAERKRQESYDSDKAKALKNAPTPPYPAVTVGDWVEAGEYGDDSYIWGVVEETVHPDLRDDPDARVVVRDRRAAAVTAVAQKDLRLSPRRR